MDLMFVLLLSSLVQHFICSGWYNLFLSVVDSLFTHVERKIQGRRLSASICNWVPRTPIALCSQLRKPFWSRGNWLYTFGLFCIWLGSNIEIDHRCAMSYLHPNFSLFINEMSWYRYSAVCLSNTTFYELSQLISGSHVHTQESVSGAGSCKRRVYPGYLRFTQEPQNSSTKNCGVICKRIKFTSCRYHRDGSTVVAWIFKEEYKKMPSK